MIIALMLLGYAALLATVGGRLLDRAAWPDRAPKLAMAAWQALSGSVLGAPVLGGLALTVSTVPVSGSVAGWLRACVMALRAQYAVPGGSAAAVGGALLTAALLARIGWCLAATLYGSTRARARQREALAVLGRVQAGLGGVTVVDCPVPVAYCLPGRDRRVVISSGALAALSEEQVRAVLAHERAHLTARHDLAISAATALARAFPRVRVLQRAARQIARLAEMSADDAATRAAHRLTVADAMLTLAAGRAPVAALGAGGTGTGERVRRLIARPAPLGRTRQWAIAGFSVALLLAPLALVATPAIAAVHLNYCPTIAPVHAASSKVDRAEPSTSI